MAERADVKWPKCQLAGCPGIQLSSAPTCLAHATEEETVAALQIVGETGTIDARGVPITNALLERILNAAPRGANEKPLIKGCRFDGATFTGDAEFSEATFVDAAFKGAVFTGYARFAGATFRNAWFDKVTFTGYAQFGGATFSYAYFGDAIFTVGAGFERATFSGYVSFGDVTFTGSAVFQGATFSGGAVFLRAKFADNAYFGEAIFPGDAGFEGTTFTGYARFAGATFKRDARFIRATFSGDAGFEKATFVSDAWFRGATFGSEARFGEAIFKRRAEFSGVRFQQARQFGPVLAYRGLVLDEVQFAQPVQIEVSSTGLCCRRARFAGGAEFRLRCARVVLEDSDFAAPSILTGIPRLSSETLARREDHILRAWQRLMADEFSERPHLVSLRRANVAGLGLSNVSATDCRFAGAHNLDKLRFESDVIFSTAPSPVGLGHYKWGEREVIAEERAWRAYRSRRRWISPEWPIWLDEQPPVALHPRQIAGLYRALRKGREDSKDEPGAADFYYGEMEMRRLSRRSENIVSATHVGKASRGQVERLILTAYWLVSGYSLRAWRAVVWLTIITALLALAFHFAGFVVPPHPISYWTSLLYAFRATLSLTDSQVVLTAWGQLLQAVLRLTGPVLLGLALLALRGRVKR